MDIDCDGSTKGPSNDSRCDPLGDRQTTTAFGDTIRKYHVGIKELNPFIHPYVVFGNDNENNKPGFVKFDPQKYGIKPLSLMAVVCGEKLVRPLPFPPEIASNPKPKTPPTNPCPEKNHKPLTPLPLGLKNP